MIERILKEKLLRMVQLYPVVSLTGPRQSGKSTLLKATFPDYRYVSLEDLDNRAFASNDPRGFLQTYSDKTIIDEAQCVPELFSYIQTRVDTENKTGMYILAGSQNFLLMQNIGQSLAGRVAVLKLLPYSRMEMRQSGILASSVDAEIFQGSYPRLYDKGMLPTEFFPSYVRTYVERDVRLLKNIGDLSLFVKFIKLCAGRIGQLLNFSSLANDCGIAVSTAQAWLSVLEASYLVYMLRPDYNNFSKRLVKSPKLYFYDTGLACSLLDIKEESQVATHFLRGGLFENLVINEFVKRAFNRDEEPEITFWRDNKGNEVDLLQTVGGVKYAYEIKAGQTASSDYFKGVKYWAGLSEAQAKQCFVIYSGTTEQITSTGTLLPINELFV